MSLFGLADIKFNKDPKRSENGPLKALEQEGFGSFKTLRYPSDLGSYDKSHYIAFFISQQKNTSFGGNFVDESLNTQGTTDTNQYSETMRSSLEKAKVPVGENTNALISGVGDIVRNVAESAKNIFGQKVRENSVIYDSTIKRISDSRFLKTTRLSKDAIALYMPDTLLYNYTQNYDTLTPGDELLGQIFAAGRSSVERFQQNGQIPKEAIAKAAAMVATQFGIEAIGAGLGQTSSARLAASAALGGAVRNPMLELIYRSPELRNFQFDFMFYPRDEKEAFETQEIINSFRFHQAPEFSRVTQGFLLPPSEFDIRFFYGGKENPNIAQIGTCVLKSIDVNYAPNGFAAYESFGDMIPEIGKTGMPVAIQLTLQFQEVNYITKESIDEPRSIKYARYTSDSQSGKYGTS
jgi:hypothetical protein